MYKLLDLLMLVLDFLRLGVGLLLHLLRATTETGDEVECRLLMDFVVGEGAAIFELLAGEDEALLVRRNVFLVLDLGLDVVDGVGGFNLQADRFLGVLTKICIFAAEGGGRGLGFVRRFWD